MVERFPSREYENSRPWGLATTLRRSGEIHMRNREIDPVWFLISSFFVSVRLLWRAPVVRVPALLGSKCGRPGEEEE